MKRNNLFKWMIALMWVFSLSVFSQTVTVKGVVKDTKGEPLVGVTAIVQGTSVGTVSDANGNFTLANIPSDSKIELSYVGMVTQLVDVNGRTNIEVILSEDTELLDEVIVVGYGTMRKRDLTGSVSSVKAEDIMRSPVTSLDQALQGKAAGVQVTQASSAPGGRVSIRVRGGNSLSSSNEPLYVVDGFRSLQGLLPVEEVSDKIRWLL